MLNLCQAAVAAMTKRESGRIVTVSSVCGVYDHAVRGGYPTAGPGTARFIKALARQAGRFGIRVNAVAPGLTDTDMTAILPEPSRDDVTETIALRRFGNAADVADLIAFLLSDEASEITGRVLEVRSTISL